MPFNTHSTRVTGFFSPVKKVAKKAKKAVIDATADVISAPARLKANADMKQADKDVAALKLARKFPKEAASFDMNGNPTDALKARTAADEVRMRRTKK